MSKQKNITIKLPKDSIFLAHSDGSLRVIHHLLESRSSLNNSVAIYRHPQLGFGATTANNVTNIKETNVEAKDTPPNILKFIKDNTDIIEQKRFISAAPASIYFPLHGKEVTVVAITYDPQEKSPVPILVFFDSNHGYGALYHYALKESL